jgi:hypothetical protein
VPRVQRGFNTLHVQLSGDDNARLKNYVSPACAELLLLLLVILLLLLVVVILLQACCAPAAH